MVKYENGTYAALACEGDRHPLELGSSVPVTITTEDGKDRLLNGTVQSIAFSLQNGVKSWKALVAVNVEQEGPAWVEIGPDDLLV